MNLTWWVNDINTRTKIRIVSINENLTKIIIDTASDVILMSSKYYNEIGTSELWQRNFYILIGFGGEETKSIRFFVHKIQVDGMKLTNVIHVLSYLDCDILLGINAISGCDLPVKREGVKKNSKKENAKGETVVYCRYIKTLKNTRETSIKTISCGRIKSNE